MYWIHKHIANFLLILGLLFLKACYSQDFCPLGIPGIIYDCFSWHRFTIWWIPPLPSWLTPFFCFRTSSNSFLGKCILLTHIYLQLLISLSHLMGILTCTGWYYWQPFSFRIFLASKVLLRNSLPYQKGVPNDGLSIFLLPSYLLSSSVLRHSGASLSTVPFSQFLIFKFLLGTGLPRTSPKVLTFSLSFLNFYFSHCLSLLFHCYLINLYNLSL